jgi:urea transport system substrate-binding protein
VGFIEDLTQAHQLEKITAIFNSMMPASIRQRITAGEERIADLCDATVIFVDVCNFTAYSRTKHPTEVVEFLARIFKVFGIIAQQYSVLQIKTIGDAMLLCINATTPRFMDGPVRAMETAIDIQKYMRANEEHKVRVGIATGTVVAGVMATDRPNFDVFGDAVNLASRLQTSAPVGGILVDEKTYDQTNHMYQYNVPTTMDIKGVGDVVTYAFSRKKMESHGSADDLHNSTQKA